MTNIPLIVDRESGRGTLRSVSSADSKVQPFSCDSRRAALRGAGRARTYQETSDYELEGFALDSRSYQDTPSRYFRQSQIFLTQLASI